MIHNLLTICKRKTHVSEHTIIKIQGVFMQIYILKRKMYDLARLKKISGECNCDIVYFFRVAAWDTNAKSMVKTRRFSLTGD